MGAYVVTIMTDGVGIKRTDGNILSDKEAENVMNQILDHLIEPPGGIFVIKEMKMDEAFDFSDIKIRDAQRLRNLETTIKAKKYQLNQSRTNVKEISQEVEALEVEKERLKKAANKEILDADSPRCGKPWETFEKDHSAEAFADLVYDLAKKYGRSTLAMRYRLLRLLVNKLPKDDLLSKVRDMIR